MAAIVLYKHGISIVSPSPTGLAGAMINQNFSSIGDALDNVASISQLTSIQSTSFTGTSVIALGASNSSLIPSNCTITGWNMLSLDGTSGTITIDVQTSTYTAFPTGTSIATTNKPNLSGTKNQALTITGWATTSLTAGQYLIFVVSGSTPTNVKNVRLELTVIPR